MNIEKDKLGIFLAQLRKDRNLTQRELADKLYVSVSTISKWEKGVSTPNIYFLEKIAEALEVPAVDLIECQIDIGVEKAAENGAAVQEVEAADERCAAKSMDTDREREEIACTPEAAEDAGLGEGRRIQAKDVKKRRRRVWAVLSAVAALCVALLLGYGYYCSMPVEMETIDSYYIANSDYYNENVYFVIVEYSGKLPDDMAVNYAMEHQGNYEKWFDMADEIIFAFFRHYRGREHVMEADYNVVFVPYRGP